MTVRSHLLVCMHDLNFVYHFYTVIIHYQKGLKKKKFKSYTWFTLLDITELKMLFSITNNPHFIYRILQNRGLVNRCDKKVVEKANILQPLRTRTVPFRLIQKDHFCRGMQVSLSLCYLPNKTTTKFI